MFMITTIDINTNTREALEVPQKQLPIYMEEFAIKHPKFEMVVFLTTRDHNFILERI